MHSRRFNTPKEKENSEIYSPKGTLLMSSSKGSNSKNLTIPQHLENLMENINNLKSQIKSSKITSSKENIRPPSAGEITISSRKNNSNYQQQQSEKNLNVNYTKYQPKLLSKGTNEIYEEKKNQKDEKKAGFDRVFAINNGQNSSYSQKQSSYNGVNRPSSVYHKSQSVSSSQILYEEKKSFLMGNAKIQQQQQKHKDRSSSRDSSDKKKKK